MRRLELAARADGLALIVDDPLTDIQRSLAALAVTQHHVDTVLTSCITDASCLSTVQHQRLLVIAMHQRHVPGRCVQPQKPWVARNPRLGECNQTGSGGRRLLDQVYGLVYRGVKIQEHGRGLYAGNFQ
ncbi:hypothetical protein ALP29_200290 [Pseudomonas syringae pv. avii]|uniref:Uncharacterized protein n=1 Tax=Pseudomonas syringae pv. avii TaxID=663959 RepID=A0A3M5UA35_PSESX|nr:hypothetical protein ALP29_200290 [Pseudomonas syringae pv. avii]